MMCMICVDTYLYQVSGYIIIIKSIVLKYSTYIFVLDIVAFSNMYLNRSLSQND